MATARGTGSPDGQAVFEASNSDLWREWHSEAGRRRLNQSAAIDALSEPLTLAEIERKHRMRRGRAFANYVLALDLWAELRGWMRQRATIVGPHLEAVA